MEKGDDVERFVLLVIERIVEAIRMLLDLDLRIETS